MGLAGQMNGAADGRVAREGDFSGREKDADAGGVGGVLRGLHEDRLGQVEFARNGLHLRVAQVIGPQHDGQRVATERGVGEHIAGVKFKHFAAA
ncbi:MAG: hypothetical protein FD162_2178 [Rhodobacteraceae bacterium]|nr:MAG: hypothetical protein FD162_2178 [Paracoccaceae bacterium]